MITLEYDEFHKKAAELKLKIRSVPSLFDCGRDNGEIIFYCGPCKQDSSHRIATVGYFKTPWEKRQECERRARSDIEVAPRPEPKPLEGGTPDEADWDKS